MPRIVIVEDELLIGIQLQHILTKYNYKDTSLFDNSDDVIDILGKQTVDLFLLDININGSMDGIELAMVIKETQGTPVVFVTSYADIDTISKAKKAMPYGYIIKPFEDVDIYSAVEIALFRTEKKDLALMDQQAIEQRFNIELTTREYETLSHLTDGLSNAQIASLQYVSVNTVKTHLRSIYSKFDISDRLKLVQTILS